MPVIAGPTATLEEADKLLSGPLGDQLGLKRTKVVLPWTTSGDASRIPPDDDPAVEIFADALPTVRACWESVVQQFADNPFGREYLIYRNETTGEVSRQTYAQVARTVQQLAHAFVEMGAEKGDRIGIAMRNYPECRFEIGPFSPLSGSIDG